MHDFISSFCPLKSFHFVNDQLCWEEHSPHPFDCHDPPRTSRTGLHDDKSPPRSAGVARSDPWRTIPAQVGFIGCALGRRRSSWVVGLDCWNNSRGKDYQQRYLRGEDLHPGRWRVRKPRTCNPGPQYPCSCGGSKLARGLRIRAQQGTRRQMIALPTPHETGWLAPRPLMRRFQSSARGTAQDQFESAHRWARCQPCTRRAWSLRAPARDLMELSLISVLRDDQRERKKLALAPPQPGVR